MSVAQCVRVQRPFVENHAAHATAVGTSNLTFQSRKTSCSWKAGQVVIDCSSSCKMDRRNFAGWMPDQALCDRRSMEVITAAWKGSDGAARPTLVSAGRARTRDGGVQPKKAGSWARCQRRQSRILGNSTNRHNRAVPLPSRVHRRLGSDKAG